MSTIGNFQPKPYDPAPSPPPHHNTPSPHNNHHNTPPPHYDHHNYTPPPHYDHYDHNNHNNTWHDYNDHNNYTPPPHYDSPYNDHNNTPSPHNDSPYYDHNNTPTPPIPPPPPVYTGTGKVAGRVDNNALDVTLDAKTVMDNEDNIEKIVVNTRGNVGKRTVKYKEVRKDKTVSILGSAEGVNGKEIIDLTVDFSKDGEKLFKGAIAGRKTRVSITGSAGKLKIGGSIGDEKVDVDMNLKGNLVELSGAVGTSTVKFNMTKSGNVDSTLSLVPLLGFTNSGSITGNVGDSTLKVAMDAKLLKDQDGKPKGTVIYTEGQVGKHEVDYKEVREGNKVSIVGKADGDKEKKIELGLSAKDGKRLLDGVIAGQKTKVLISSINKDQYKFEGSIGDKKVDVRMKTKGNLVELSGKVGTSAVNFSLTRKADINSVLSIVPLLGFLE